MSADSPYHYHYHYPQTARESFNRPIQFHKDRWRTHLQDIHNRRHQTILGIAITSAVSAVQKKHQSNKREREQPANDPPAPYDVNFPSARSAPPTPHNTGAAAAAGGIPHYEDVQLRGMMHHLSLHPSHSHAHEKDSQKDSQGRGEETGEEDDLPPAYTPSPRRTTTAVQTAGNPPFTGPRDGWDSMQTPMGVSSSSSSSALLHHPRVAPYLSAPSMQPFLAELAAAEEALAVHRGCCGVKRLQRRVGRAEEAVLEEATRLEGGGKEGAREEGYGMGVRAGCGRGCGGRCGHAAGSGGRSGYDAWGGRGR